MNYKLKQFWESKKVTIIILLSIFVLLVGGTFATKKRVFIDRDYYTKENVSLYIYTYGELPKNFITKSTAKDYLKWNSSKVIKEGRNIGGDTFAYVGAIKNFTDNSSLAEADIYTNRQENIKTNSRGKERLVFTRNTNYIQVFYTDKHYNDFEKVSLFKLQLISNILKIITYFYLLCLLIAYLLVKRRKKIMKKAFKPNEEDTITFTF